MAFDIQCFQDFWVDRVALILILDRTEILFTLNKKYWRSTKNIATTSEAMSDFSLIPGKSISKFSFEPNVCDRVMPDIDYSALRNGLWMFLSRKLFVATSAGTE